MLDRLSQFFGQDHGRQQEYQDFAQRYNQDPSQISDAEAARRYREMMSQMHDQDDVNQQAFGQLPQEDRRVLVQRFQDATRDPAWPYQGYPQDLDLDRAAEPRSLAAWLCKPDATIRICWSSLLGRTPVSTAPARR